MFNLKVKRMRLLLGKPLSAPSKISEMCLVSQTTFGDNNLKFARHTTGWLRGGLAVTNAWRQVHEQLPHLYGIAHDSVYR